MSTSDAVIYLSLAASVAGVGILIAGALPTATTGLAVTVAADMTLAGSVLIPSGLLFALTTFVCAVACSCVPGSFG